MLDSSHWKKFKKGLGIKILPPKIIIFYVKSSSFSTANITIIVSSILNLFGIPLNWVNKIVIRNAFSFNLSIGTTILFQEGKDFSDVYRDFTVLALFWEVYFFSPVFKHQSKASDILNDHPKLPQHLVNTIT